MPIAVDEPEVEEQRDDPFDELDKEFVNDLIDKILVFCETLSGHKYYNYQRPFARRIVESVVIRDADEISGLAARQCLDGDTVVFRRDGTATRLRDHEDAWSTGVKPTKRYVIKGGAEIIATDNHPVMTDRGWVDAGDLREGDKVATLTEWDMPGDTSLDPGFARFLGYMVTDGTGSWRAGSAQSPKFTNIRAAYLDEVELLAKELFGISSKRYAKGNGFDLLLTGKRGNGRNPVTEWLSQQAMDHGFPTQVFTWTSDMVAEFINRAWAGDGCIRVKTSSGGKPQPEVFLACGNDEVYTRYWQMLLYKIGVTSTVKREVMTKGTGVFHRLVLGPSAENLRRFFGAVGPVFGKEEQSTLVMDSLPAVIEAPQKDPGCPGYKRHKYLDGRVPGRSVGLPGGTGKSLGTPCVRCGWKNPRIGVGMSFTRPRAIDLLGQDGEKFTYRPIIRIEDAGEREVFDVEYPGKGWFVAQGTYVSNSGKTELIANTVAGLMILLPVLAKIYPKLLGVYAEGLWVGLFAPVEGQAETLYARVVSRLTSDRAKEILSDPELNFTLKRIPGTVRGSRLSNQSVVMMMTANPKAKIESKTFHLIVIDECQESDDVVVNKSISPMLAHYKGTMIKAGTPTYTKNNFYNTIQLNKRTQTRRGSRQNHFQWTWKEVAKEVPDYGDFIKKEILKLGEDSDEFNLSYCVAPATRILTADLRHIPASEVRVGQELVGFDEHVPGFHLHRKTKTATVEKVERLTLPSSRITLSDGTVVVASDDHLWLVRTSGSRTAWMKTSDLGSKRYATRGQLPRIIRVTDVWDEAPNTYEKGYLAAAFDGEGHLSCSKPGCATLAFSQKEGDMLQQVRDMVRDFGFSKSEHVQPQGVTVLAINGGSNGISRFLGMVRPQRLLSKFAPEMMGSLTRRGAEMLHPQVVSVEPLGEIEVVAIQTSTRTFIAEGLASHNCARYLLDRGMFITTTVMDELCDPSMETVKAYHHTPVVVGIDPARKQDSTVVTVVYVDWDRPDEFGYFHHRVLNWLEIQGDDWEAQYHQIVDFLASYNVLAVGVDANGVGDAVAQRLNLLLPRAEVIPLTSSQQEQSKRFKHLQSLIQRKQIAWPGHSKARRLRTWKRFYQQMTDAEKDFKGNVFLVKAPDEPHAHDDYCDSLSLATVLTLDLTMPTVQTANNPFFRR